MPDTEPYERRERTVVRKSKKAEIVDAALRIVERDGLPALTYESLATESGLTKGGLLYHFPSRDALIQTLHEHLARGWEDDMTAAGGADPDEAGRWAAYARVATTGATRTDLLLMLDARDEPKMAPWRQVMDTWAPPVPTDPDDEDALKAFVARLAADGLWLFEAVQHGELTAEMRTRVAAYIAANL